MRFYIATRLENHQAHRNLSDVLVREFDNLLTYDWTRHGSVQKEGIARIREVSLLEARGVEEAQLLIALLPGGRGTHVEIGMAIGRNIPIVIQAEDAEFSGENGRTVCFYHHPLVRQVSTESGFSNLIDQIRQHAIDFGLRP